MLEFRDNMDAHSLAVHRRRDDGTIIEIGCIQWHPDSEPRFVMYVDLITEVSLSELRFIVAKLSACLCGGKEFA